MLLNNLKKYNKYFNNTIYNEIPYEYKYSLLENNGNLSYLVHQYSNDYKRSNRNVFYKIIENIFNI